MISGDFSHCTTLEQFYAEIKALHRTAHGHAYTTHHEDLVGLMKYCQSYKELGVNQGATAAAVMLQAPKYIELIDLVIDHFKPQQHLFEQFAQENDVALRVIQSSSTDPKLVVTEVDMMLVDTIHEPSYVVKELQKHAPKVLKYIIIHDTGTFPAIHTAAASELLPKGWQVLWYCDDGAGHSVFVRNDVQR
jgi:hypothetical protein